MVLHRKTDHTPYQADVISADRVVKLKAELFIGDPGGKCICFSNVHIIIGQFACLYSFLWVISFGCDGMRNKVKIPKDSSVWMGQTLPWWKSS